MPIPSNDQLEAARQIGDPPADTLLTEYLAAAEPGAAHRFFDRLIREIELPLADLPDNLADFLRDQQGRELPIADTDLARAQALFLDHGPKLLVLLYYQSLPLLYSMANGAQVLVQTGRLDRPAEDWRTFTRRIAETAQFLLAVMQPNGLVPDGQGRTYATKVRLIHAAIRHFVGQRPDWDSATLGVAINQEDLLATLLTFSSAPLDGLHHFGIELNPKDETAYQRSWNAIGLLLGIQPDLLPHDPAEARSSLARILERQSAPSEAGKTLTDALLRFGQETLGFQQLRVVPQSLIHYLIGSERAGYLGVAEPQGCVGRIFPHFLGTLLRQGERLEDQSTPKKRSLLEDLSRLTISGMLAYFDSYKDRSFFVPSALATYWGLVMDDQ